MSLSCLALYIRLINDRVLARTAENSYFPGVVKTMKNGQVLVLFDNGDKVTHSSQTFLRSSLTSYMILTLKRNSHVIVSCESPSHYVGYVDTYNHDGNVRVPESCVWSMWTYMYPCRIQQIQSHITLVPECLPGGRMICITMALSTGQVTEVCSLTMMMGAPKHWISQTGQQSS